MVVSGELRVWSRNRAVHRVDLRLARCSILPAPGQDHTKSQALGRSSAMSCSPHRLHRWVALVALLASCDCGTTDPVPDAATDAHSDLDVLAGRDSAPPPVMDGRVSTPAVIVAFGQDVASAVRIRIEEHIRAVATRPVLVAESQVVPAEGSLVLAIGDHPLSREVIQADELSALGPEGFIVRSASERGYSVLAAAGNALDAIPPGSNAHGSLGTGFAAYAALEELGFAFLHPLAPIRPAALPIAAPSVDRIEARRWRIRGLQLHTMHPLELTNLLNGWGPAGHQDRSDWEAMLPEWDRFLEWMLANRQNHVHWVLLYAETWSEFADSEERLDRLRTLVQHAHRAGVLVGVDVPIALHQQHAWRLIREQGDSDDELRQLRDRVDYLMGAGFDYLATESGNSEFTSPNAGQMLQWMNTLAIHLDEQHQRQAFIKIHVSQGQTAEGFTDPETGGELNFNLLPHYADARLGVLPHSVQHYALNDPAPTYGNTDFDYMRRFLRRQAGHRPTVWHPESAYWVSFDIDVPLFLPVYFYRRFHDLWLIADDEAAGRTGVPRNPGAPMDGQLTFSSGWEWGYWLNDVIAARAAWSLTGSTSSPASDEASALRELMVDTLRVFGEAAEPVADQLIAMAEHQHQLLTLGDHGDGPPETIERRSGIAYLQGFDAWDDVADAAASVPFAPHIAHQPDKLGLVEMRNPLHSPPGYTAEVDPLLAAMEDRFGRDAQALESLRASVPDVARPLFDELVDAANITALRAQQIHGLYDYVDLFFSTDTAGRAARLATARSALDQAATIVAQREANYRVPADRIAGWRTGPTAYQFGYLWTARSLHYWWRDEGKVIDVPVSPCYLNIISGVDVGFGEGYYADLGDTIAGWGSEVWGVSGVTACLGVPPSEPTYPQNEIRAP